MQFRERTNGGIKMLDSLIDTALVQGKTSLVVLHLVALSLRRRLSLREQNRATKVRSSKDNNLTHDVKTAKPLIKVDGFVNASAFRIIIQS